MEVLIYVAIYTRRHVYITCIIVLTFRPTRPLGYYLVLLLINKSSGDVETQKLFTLGMKTKKYQLLS